MQYDFDEVVARSGTNCLKWEFIATNTEILFGDHADPKYGDDQLLPLWVADMDFKAPPAVIEAITERARHGIFGYSFPYDSYYDAVINWFDKRHNRYIERDWIVITSGVVPALSMLVATFIEPGEKVIIQPPVYHPFYEVIPNQGGQIAPNPLLYEDGRYRMDYEDLEQKAADPAVKMAILCSPHNPVGRVWTAEELTRFGEICLQNDVLVVSDEIHCDLIFDGQNFTSFASVSEQFAQKSIVCTAPSKTFNLAGLQCSNIIIPDSDLREMYVKTLVRNGQFGANAIGIAATEAAYNEGEDWLMAAMAYIQDNFQALKSYLAEHLPQVKVVDLEGTYLAWLDFGDLDIDFKTRNKLIFDQARVYLNTGTSFGREGASFERINIACPRSVLMKALERIAVTIQQAAIGQN